MDGHIPRDAVDEIRSRVNIVDLVSEHVTLKKAGRNFVGLCPFHKEKTPSFTVNADKQIFYCFGCHEGGNAISFVMKINNMTFPDAVTHLARKMGIAIQVREPSPKERKEAGEREKLLQINRMAMEFFSKTLASSRGETARAYLRKRGIGEPVQEKFHLGYVVDEWRELRRFFEDRKVPLPLVEKAGFLVRKDNGDYFDRFRGRIMFPISDLNGNVIAFGGRVLGDGEPKYMNSPETPVYTKGRTLFGLYETRDDIRKKDSVVIVEGYFDFLALWIAGAKHVVASLGTALTRDQVELLKRFTRNVVLIFDPDEAGKSATERGLQLFLEEKMHSRIVILPGGCDPADYVAKFGAEKAGEVLDQSHSMVDYYIDHVIGKTDTLEEHADTVRSAVSFIAGIRDPVERNLFVRRVSERLGIDEGLIKNEITSAPGRSRGPAPVRDDRPRKRAGTVDAVELTLLCLMAERPEKIPLVAEEHILSFFMDPELARLGRVLVEEKPEASEFVSALPEGAVKEKLLALMVDGAVPGDDLIDRVFSDTIKRIREKWFKMKHRMLKTEIQKAQEAGDTERCTTLLREKESLLKEERKALQAGAASGNAQGDA